MTITFVKVAARLADELRPLNNNGVIWANQFDNTANAKGHYEGTGREIWEQTDGKVRWFCLFIWNWRNHFGCK